MQTLLRFPDGQSAGHPHAPAMGIPGDGNTAAVVTGYNPLRDDEPELARTMAASVTQRIAFGEGPEGPAPTPSRQRAGQHVRRIGSEFGYEGDATGGYALAR